MSTELVEQLESDVRRLASDYLTKPPFHMFHPLAELRAEVFDILDRHPRLEFLRDLYSLGGRLSALLAHASSDLGNSSAADSHARTAWICADLAGDRRLGAYTRWIQSNVAYWSVDYSAAARIARTGREVADHPDDELRLASQEARAHAAQRDEHGARDALQAVGILRDRLAGSPGMDGVFHFGPGKAAYYSSEARLALGGPRNVRLAITDAQESLRLLAGSSVQDGSRELIAAARLDLTSALIADNDLDAAVEAIQPVLAVLAESRTVPVIGRIGGVGRSVAQAFPGVVRADDLRERIALFQAYPAARELPSILGTT